MKNFPGNGPIVTPLMSFVQNAQRFNGLEYLLYIKMLILQQNEIGLFFLPPGIKKQAINRTIFLML